MYITSTPRLAAAALILANCFVLAQVTSMVYPASCLDPTATSKYSACINALPMSFSSCGETDYSCDCVGGKAEFACWTDFCPGATDVVCMQSLEIHDLCVAANMAPPVFKDYACPTTFSDMPTSASYLPASTAAGSPAMSKAATTAAGSVAGSTATAAAKTSTAGAAFVHGSPIMGAVLPIGGVLAFGIVGLAMFL